MKSIPFPNVFLAFAAFILLSSFSCEPNKMTTDSNPIDSLNQISISFSGMSGYTDHQISKDGMTTSTKGRSGNVGDTKKTISKDQWKKINEIVSKIDLAKMDSWESPTQERFHDGARATTITIESNGQAYSSQSFDEGKPPAQLQDIYDYLQLIVNP